MTKQDIEHQITRMEKKLEETRESFSHNRGHLNDTMRVVIPMMEDQLKLMRSMLDIMPN